MMFVSSKIARLRLVFAVGVGMACGLSATAQSAGSSPAVVSPGSASVSGLVMDQDGDALSGAKAVLTIESTAEKREALVDEQGRFTFASVPPGRFTLRVTVKGMTQGGGSGTLKPGQQIELPKMTLKAEEDLEVDVSPKSTEEIAEAEVKAAEQQRLFGFAPNFYVVYRFDAPALTPKQKWSLTYKSTLDPLTFLIVGGFAGIQQATNSYPGFGQGAQGYGKRYGSTFANVAIGNVLGGYAFPVLFKQDPRYFYKGTGTTKSRALYALSTAFIARGDNGKWQPAYAEFAAAFAAGGLSNLYYARSDRQGATLTVENSLIGIGFTGVGNLLQEFLFRKLSTHSKP